MTNKNIWMKNILLQILGDPTFLNFYIIDSFRNDDDFLAGLLVMGALFFLLALAIGIIVVLILFAILFFLISGGIISASVLVGLQQKSVSKGFKTLFLSVCILGTTIISVIFFGIINSMKNWWANDISVVIGIIFGLISGWLLGLLIFNATKKLVLFFKAKFNDRINSKSIE